MNKSFLAAILRLILLAGIINSAVIGRWDVVTMYLSVFIITLPLLWLARADYYALDAGAMLLFLLAFIITFTIGWPDHYHLLTYDKLLHAAGGAWLAWFAAVLLRKRIKDKVAFYIAIVSVAIAIGGLWEVFEWILSLLPQPLHSPSTGHADSMMDLIADSAGAGAAAVVLYLRRYL